MQTIGNGSDENGRLRMLAVPNGEGYDPSDSYLVILEKSEERTSGYFEDSLKGLMECSSQGWAAPCCAIIDSFLVWAIKITAPLMSR